MLYYALVQEDLVAWTCLRCHFVCCSGLQRVESMTLLVGLVTTESNERT